MDSHGDPGPSTMENRTLAQAPRVSQVDADDLDESLVSMLSERLQKSLGNFKTTHGLDLRPELSLVLKLVIFRYEVWDQTILASPGAKLQNLRLASPSAPYQKPSRNLLLLYLLLHPPILPTYILTRIRQHALSQQWPDLPQRDWRKKAWKAVVWGENVARAWELLGWTWFLFDGKYPSILMRILKLRLVPSSPHLTKLVSYEFMNRQLVWSTFTEFLMFSVPLLPPVPDYLRPAALVAPIKAVFEQPKSIDYSSITLEPSANSEKSSAGSTQAHAGPYASLPLSTCPICYSRRVSKPVSLSDSVSGARISLPRLDQVDGEDVGGGEERIFVPAQTDCWGGCRWCYYCIAGELAEFEAKSTKTAKPVKPASTAQRGVKGVQEEKMEEEVKWDCLRCGGGATKAWRVGGTRPEVKSEA